MILQTNLAIEMGLLDAEIAWLTLGSTLLSAAGCVVGGRMSDIAKVTVFITDMTTLDAIHRVRSEFFERPYPASSLVQVVNLVKPEFLIEIEAVAVIPFDRVKDPA